MNKTKEKKIIIKKQLLKNGLKTTNNFYEAIYIIGKTMISGEFDYGCRGIDHNELLVDEITWEELLHYGTILIPETMCAIGKKHYNICKNNGYKFLPVKKGNHIMGY